MLISEWAIQQFEVLLPSLRVGVYNQTILSSSLSVQFFPQVSQPSDRAAPPNTPDRCSRTFPNDKKPLAPLRHFAISLPFLSSPALAADVATFSITSYTTSWFASISASTAASRALLRALLTTPGSSTCTST